MRASLLIALTALVIPPVISGPHAGAATAERVETPVSSTSPITSVTESAVSVRIPLPASVGAHPAACDWISYLRWRDRSGPADRSKADRVLIAQPGIFEGAGAFDSVARNTVAAAAAAGKHIEFWALDRRSNCLEDHTGVQAGLATGDVHTAIDYYYRDKKVDGRTFAGYRSGDDVAWLAHVGLAQTERDQYDLMVNELPDPAFRRTRTFCGGHSLGGFLTGFFAEWDFDGDPATTDDAGYDQCAGYFALDSTIAAGAPGMSKIMPANAIPPAGQTPAQTQTALDTGQLAPVLQLPVVINPETMNLLGIAGLAARLNPHGESDLVRSIPSNTNIDVTLRFLFSRDLANFVSGSPSARDFRLTNEAALGALLDNNSQPLAFLQTSVGFFDGGSIADKNFPLPNQLIGIPELSGLKNLVGTDRKAVPANTGLIPGTGPLYTWRNYDRVGAPDDPVYRSSDGTPFTGPDKEVTDIGELARSLAEAPLDFTEGYFPTKLSTDLYQSDSPEISEYAVHKDGIAARPVITLLGGSGISLSNGEIDPPPITAPGYHHLDVLTAAATQNTGKPEIVSTELVRWALAH
ncbi:hypothetical protein GCM10029978_039260 [Actinoallomurus acanthiterrae]